MTNMAEQEAAVLVQALKPYTYENQWFDVNIKQSVWRLPSGQYCNDTQIDLYDHLSRRLAYVGIRHAYAGWIPTSYQFSGSSGGNMIIPTTLDALIDLVLDEASRHIHE